MVSIIIFVQGGTKALEWYWDGGRHHRMIGLNPWHCHDPMKTRVEVVYLRENFYVEK